MPRELLWAVILGLAIAVAALWPSHYPYGQAPKIETQQQSKDSVSSQESSGYTSATPISAAGNQQNPHRGENVPELTFLGIRPGEWLLAIVTCMLWLATVRLVSEGRRTAERQLRAYVFVDFELLAKADGWSLKATIKNSGQTPAYQCRAVISAEVLSLPTREEDFYPRDEFHSRADLSKDGTFIVTWKEAVTAEQVAAINAGAKGFYVFSIVRYIDAFGHEQTAHTRMVNRPGMGNGLSYCPEGNDQT